MSDLYMYEFGDIVWDEFGESDDHMVPHPSKRPGGESNIQSDSCKKSKHEVDTVSGNIGNMRAAYGVVPGNEKTSFVSPKRKDTMLEKVLWPHSPHDVLPASCDGDIIQEVTGLAPDDSKMLSCFKSSNIGSGGSQLCGNDLTCSARCIGMDNNVYQYPLTQISQTDNDVILFNNDLEHKEGTGILYDGLLDFGNFEDVDKMFSSCDSTFGLGSVCNDNEMDWYTPSNALGGSENFVKSGMRLSCSESAALGSITDYPEAHKVNNESSLIDNCNKEGVSLDFKTSSCISDANQPAAQNDLSSMSGSSVISDIKDDFMLKEKANIPHMMNSCGYQSDQMPFSPTLYGNSCETNAHPSFCPRESSSSNQVQSEESSHYNQLQAPPVTGGLRREKPFRRQGLHATSSNNSYYGNSVVQAAPFDPIKFQEKMHVCENEVGDHSDVVAVNVGAPTKIDYSNVPESSRMSSLDEISVEVTSFQQLQQVTKQLDIRTKLCIRDSLYRLATSAEQRHCANKNGCSRDGGKNGAPVTEKTDEHAGFMGMETDTNPIDRSIAHLLFYSPSDPSRPSANDAHCHKSNPMVRGSITSPPLLAKKIVREETAAAGE